MDLPLMQTLFSMKRLEEDPDFQTHQIDLATFVPAYTGVIVVDQKLVDDVDLKLKIGSLCFQVRDPEERLITATKKLKIGGGGFFLTYLEIDRRCCLLLL